MRAQETGEQANGPARPPYRSDRAKEPHHGEPELAGGSAARLLGLQRTAGNAAVSQLIQRQAGPPEEEQADEVQRQAGPPEEEQVDGVQRSVQDTLRSSGRPLDGPVRREMEARLGADFSSVRVHADAAAQRSAADIGARAYTSGEHVVVGSGSADKHVLAHELTHVIQQRQGPVAGTDNGSGVRVSDPSDRFERAAEANARRVMSGPAPAAGTGGQAATGGQAHASGAVHRMVAEHGSGVQRMNAAGGQQQAPAPVLTGVHLTSADEEGRVGNFARVRQWQVANPQQGVIIQHVTRVFNVHAWDANNQVWVRLANANLDSYVTDPNSSVHATVQQYWELWRVSANGTVSDGGEDTFGLPSIIPTRNRMRDTTAGTFTITGTANFYPTTVSPRTLGFTRGSANSVAGGLYVRYTDPATDLAANGVVASGWPVFFQATSTWNSTGATSANAASMYSTVTP